MATLAPQEQVQQQTVGGASCERPCGDTRLILDKPWKLENVFSSQYRRRQTLPLPGCVVPAVFQNTRRFVSERHEIRL